MKNMLKKLSVIGLAILSLTVATAKEKDSSLLFAVDFDNWSVNAGFAKGDPKCYSFKNPDLQLRMFPGIKGQGNALAMTNGENCTYKLPGNFDARQGTVSMWVSPQNWKVSSSKWQQFFVVSTPKFTISLYKYIWAKHLMFYLRDRNLPKKKQTFTAMTMLEDKNWPVGKWHKLDITWDAKGMKLYIDGVMPAVYHKNSQLRKPFEKFQNPLTFPAPESLKKYYMTIGMPKGSRKNSGTDLSYKTAYDDIKIYNRPLSAAEIKNAYEKYFPSKLASKLRRPVITIPKSNRKINVDGKINRAEWADAGLVPVSGFLGKALPDVSAKVYYKYDNKNLYIGMRANRACRMLKNYKTHDGKLWQEDSFEIILQSPQKNIYHLVINGNGAVYDELDTNKKWQSSARCAAVRGKDYWSAEIAIPLKSFKTSPAGQQWQGNFGATYYTHTGNYSGWSKILYSYTDAKSFGIIRFGKDNTAVRLNKIGNLSLGKLDLSVDLVPKDKISQVKISAECQPDGAAVIKFPGQLAGQTWETTLPIGKQNIQIKGLKGSKKELVFLYEKFAYVNFPLEIGYTCWVKRHYIEVNIDLNNSGAGNLKAVKNRGLAGKVELIDAKGKIHSTQSFTAKKSNCDVNLKLPDNLPSGKYSIRVEVDGIKAKLTRATTFSVPDMTPYKLKVAADHSIPDPWKPITTLDDKTFKLLDREYTFAGGAFPVQAISRGEKLLTSPVTMLCNGQPVKWSNFKIVEKHQDVIKLSGSGTAGKVTFQWNGELWFDGMYSLNLKMSPSGKTDAKIKSLNIVWAMPEQFAKFVMTPTYNKWQNDQIKLLPNPSSIAAREHLVWLTGHLRGFLWWPESNANWVNKKAEKPIVISRANGTVNVALNIISKPVELTKPAVYKMAFMATPAKDQPKKFRAFHPDGFGRSKGQNVQHIGWGSFRNKFSRDDTTTPTSQIPRDPAAYKKIIQIWRDRGITPLTYGMPGQISSKSAEYDYFNRTWAKIPSHNHRLTKGGKKYILQRCCGNTKVTDLFAYRTEKLFKQYPKLGGLYYDVGASGFCQNREHGHGGIDAFGQTYFSSGALALRQSLMRLYKLHKKYGKTFFYHSHSHFNPVCHTFIDYWYPGEQYYRMIAKNYKYAYCEGISLEEFQSELNGKIKGVGVQFLPQYGRAASIQSIKHMKKEFNTSPEWAIRTMTPLLLHDVNISAAYIDGKVTVPKLWKIQDDNKFSDAEFFGYWTTPGVKSSSPKVMVSVYSWKKAAPYQKILAVANMGKTEQPAALVLDLKRLGIKGKVKYFDLWNNKPLTAAALKTTKIKGNHFMLIGIK